MDTCGVFTLAQPMSKATLTAILTEADLSTVGYEDVGKGRRSGIVVVERLSHLQRLLPSLRGKSAVVVLSDEQFLGHAVPDAISLDDPAWELAVRFTPLRFTRLRAFLDKRVQFQCKDVFRLTDLNKITIYGLPIEILRQAWNQAPSSAGATRLLRTVRAVLHKEQPSSALLDLPAHPAWNDLIVTLEQAVRAAMTLPDLELYGKGSYSIGGNAC